MNVITKLIKMTPKFRIGDVVKIIKGCATQLEAMVSENDCVGKIGVVTDVFEDDNYRSLDLYLIEPLFPFKCDIRDTMQDLKDTMQDLKNALKYPDVRGVCLWFENQLERDPETCEFRDLAEGLTDEDLMGI